MTKLRYRRVVLRSSPLVCVSLYILIARQILKQLVRMAELNEREE